MDSCSSSAYASEESEGGGKFVFKVRDSSRVYKGKPEKLGGYGSLSPDGAESSTDGDEHAPPRVRARDERRPLLDAETTQRALTATATAVMPARATSLPPPNSPPDKPSSALTQALVDSPKQRPAMLQQSRENQRETPKKKKLTDSSSLVASSSEDDHPLPLANKPLPRHKRPDWRKPVGHHSPDGVQRLANDGNASALPAKSRDAHVVLPDTRPTLKKDEQVNLSPSSSTVDFLPRLSQRDVVRKYAVKAPFKRITSEEGPSQNGKRPATDAEIHEITSMMRERALNSFKAKPGINRFELLFLDKRYAHIDDRSKIEGLFGYATPVSSKNTSDTEQKRYYEEVSRLYALNNSEKGPAKLVENKQDNYTAEALENLIWKLTPNQRHGLREKFHGLYGNSVLRDDTNWMFFDTIIRLYTKDENKQRSLMKKIFSASENTRLKERDELLDIIHSHLTPTQREYLKLVCKERHDGFLYSRLPLLQIIIMENNQEALEDYENVVLRFMHANDFCRLFNSRICTLGANPTYTGDGAFFTMSQWGSIDMMLHFLSFILTNVTLSGREKMSILKSKRHSDNVSALHMVMAAGDYKRVKAVLMHLNLLAQQVENWFGVPKAKFNDPTPVSFAYTESLALICGTLLNSSMEDLSRRYGLTNGYTRAIDHGHIKCAKMFRKRLRHNWRYYIDSDREAATDYQKIEFKPNGEKFRKDAFKDAKNKEKQKAENEKIWIKLYPDANERKKVRDELAEKNRLDHERAKVDIARDRKILKDREEAKKNNRPISAERTYSEKWIARQHALIFGSVFAKAFLTYHEMDEITGFINRRELKRQKRLENPTPLRVAIKAMTPLLTPNDTGSLKSETKPRKSPKYIARPESFTPSRFTENKLPKNPDGSPKPRTGKWYGEKYELKKLKKQEKQDNSTTPGKQGYTKFEDESEGA